MGNQSNIENLVDENLLDLDDSHQLWMNWRIWLSNYHIQIPSTSKSLQVNSYPLLIEAAKNGQGIALGWKYLIDKDLDSGSLVKPTNESLTTELGYYLVWPDHISLSSEAIQFKSWCLNEITDQ